MSIVTTDSANYAAIAEAIRDKNGGTDTYTPAQMAAAIAGITGGGSSEDLLAARLINTMKTYSNPDITSVIACGFGYQTNLESVSLPNCTTLNTGAFYGCTSLVEINLPSLKNIMNNTFRNCSSLTAFISGSAFDSRIDASTFEGCSKITKVDLRHVNSQGISHYGLACAALVTLIIRNTDFVPPLLAASAFGAETTPMRQGIGYIYVPASMADSYKTATNWAVFAEQIRAIEDYPEVTGG